MARLLIGAGAGREGTEVSEALTELLPVKPVDIQLVSLLLEQGQADANFDQGSPVALGKKTYTPIATLTNMTQP
jgi:hypothetical protein